MPESEFEYFSRRAIEEGCAASRAACATTRAAHRRLSAAYSAMIARQLPPDAEIDNLLQALN